MGSILIQFHTGLHPAETNNSRKHAWWNKLMTVFQNTPRLEPRGMQGEWTDEPMDGMTGGVFSSQGLAVPVHVPVPYMQTRSLYQ